jgi:hypothetical protein
MLTALSLPFPAGILEEGSTGLVVLVFDLAFPYSKLTQLELANEP